MGAITTGTGGTEVRVVSPATAAGRGPSADVSPGVAFAVAVNVSLLGTGAALAAYWWLARGRTGGDDGSVAAWCDEAATLAAEVQAVAERPDGAVVDHDRVQRRILPVSERLKGHARAAPAGVDDDVVAALHDLGVDCYEVGMEHTTREAVRTGEFLEDELDDLAATAERVEAEAASRAGNRGAGPAGQ